MKPACSPFQSHDWQNATAHEFQQAGGGYIASCGVYEVDEEKGTVTHIPSVGRVFAQFDPWKATSFGATARDRHTLRTTGSVVEDRPSTSSRLELAAGRQVKLSHTQGARP